MVRRILTDLLIGILVCVILISGWKLFSYWQAGNTSNQLQQDAIDIAVKPVPTVPEATEILPNENESLPEDSPNPFPVYAPISVDFEALRQINDDSVAWIYNPGTKIHYPIVQTEDNSYYLHRGLDGSDNNPGTLFMDFRNSSDLSDQNTIVYGHNMRNYTMFGTLTEYNSQEYYDKHPFMFILTPNADFKIELVAGTLISEKSDLYNFTKIGKDMSDVIAECIEDSTFETEVTVQPDDRFITLSTCSYEYPGARYVVIGIVRELDQRAGK